jgi:hypothetical protein
MSAVDDSTAAEALGAGHAVPLGSTATLSVGQVRFHIEDLQRAVRAPAFRSLSLSTVEHQQPPFSLLSALGQINWQHLLTDLDQNLFFPRALQIAFFIAYAWVVVLWVTSEYLKWSRYACPSPHDPAASANQNRAWFRHASCVDSQASCP